MAEPTWIDLSEVQLAEACSLAEATYRKYRAYSGHYRNLPRSHLIGKVGEIAVENWLRVAGVCVDGAFRNSSRDAEPDIILASGAYDVKTWSPQFWMAYGRCVTPQQFETKFQVCAGVIWAVAYLGDDSARVSIMGWSTVSDIGSAPIRDTGPIGREVRNHQVDLAKIRALETLPLGPKIEMGLDAEGIGAQ